MRQKIRKIWNVINSILLGVLILLAVALVGVRLVGLDLYVVLSGSMEPEYKTGSVIYVKETEATELEVGDVITYQIDAETVATHRIIEITEVDGDVAFRTKGDANEMEDATAVLANQVVGTPIFTIPNLGYLVSYIHTASGRYAVIAVGATLLLLMFLPDLIFEEEKKSKNEEVNKE